MRFIRDILAEARRTERPTVSVEFFPTKTDEGERTLLEKTVPSIYGPTADVRWEGADPTRSVAAASRK